VQHKREKIMIILRKNKGFNFLLGISLVVFFPLGFSIFIFLKIVYTKRYYKSVMGNELIYTYDTLHKSLNRAYYIEDLRYRDDFISFYENFRKGDEAYAPFPLKQLPFNKKIFKIAALDSSVIEVVDFDTLCWGYIHGYVHKGSVTSTLPQKAMSDNWALTQDYLMASNPPVKETRRSDYGIQCECVKR
jgi:hypothetical protein